MGVHREGCTESREGRMEGCKGRHVEWCREPDYRLQVSRFDVVDLATGCDLAKG